MKVVWRWFLRESSRYCVLRFGVVDCGVSDSRAGVLCYYCGV